MPTRRLRKLGDGEFGISMDITELRYYGIVDENDELVNPDQRVRLIDEGDQTWTVEVLERRVEAAD